MPSVDALAAAIRAAIDRNRGLIAGLDASRERAAEFRDELSALGVEAKAAQAASIVDSLEEMRAEASVITAGLESALAATEAIRTGTTGGGGGAPPEPPTPASLTPEPPRGWDSAPDLATARDSMPKLGEVPIGREIHILDGDGNGKDGGHRWDSEIPGKTKFPRSWGDDKIIEAVGDIARRPDHPPSMQANGRWRCTGQREGVTVRVVLDPDGSVWTAHPVSGPGVDVNPR